MRLLRLGLIVALGFPTSGCLGVLAKRELRDQPADRGAAARIYAIAEGQRKAGEYANAVLLVRHAILQLPESEQSDAVRHKLILRMAYLELMAYDDTGDVRFAQDAQKMLEAYVAKHEALFGDSLKAKNQRGEVYELLYEVELVLEGADPTGGVGDDATLVATAGPRAQGGPTAPVRRASQEEELPDEPVDTHAGEVVEATMKRKVRVRKSRLAQPDDPRVRRRIESSVSDGHRAAALTHGRAEKVHGPRPLVRAAKLPRHARKEAPKEERRLARQLGYELLRSSRPRLKQCYVAAFARNPADVALSTVEVSVQPDGRVKRAKVLDGKLVDGLGDVCVVEQISRTTLARDDARPEVRLRLPLVFFYQDTVMIDEPSGQTLPAGNQGQDPATPPRGALGGHNDIEYLYNVEGQAGPAVHTHEGSAGVKRGAFGAMPSLNGGVRAGQSSNPSSARGQAGPTGGGS